MKTRNIIALCALIVLSILTACNSKTEIKEKQAETNTHDSFSNREKVAPNDSVPLERKLIPPKQIDDLRNFQVVYCFDIDSSFLMCDYHLFSMNGRFYEPRVILSYRNSSLDSMLWANALGYMEYSKKDFENDSTLYSSCSDFLNFWYRLDSLNAECTIDESKKIRIYKNKLIDNGRTFDIDVINYNEYYCYYKNMLVIYKFTKNLVSPIYTDDTGSRKNNALHLPYVFNDTPFCENGRTKLFRLWKIIITSTKEVTETATEAAIENGQNTMRLDEYTISSSQLDSIINMVLSDVKDKNYIHISAKNDENNNYTIYVSAFSSPFLSYSSNIIGYTHKGDKTILFYSSVKDMITKKTDSHKKSFSCIPPPTKDNPLLILGTDGGKEWVFSIDVDNGEILLLRKNLEW